MFADVVQVCQHMDIDAKRFCDRTQCITIFDGISLLVFTALLDIMFDFIY